MAGGSSTCVRFFTSMLSSVVLIVAWTVMLMSSVESKFVVEKSSIRVMSPSHLRSKRYDAAIANFGVPDYGGSMLGTLLYPKKGSSRLGCSPFEGHNPFKSSSPGRPTILLLDRGDCYFAFKVWNGQQGGAAAVLVADTIDEPLITMDSPEESSDADGYIDKIEIPSALIERSLGQALKDALDSGGGDVVVKIDWTESMPHPDRRVEYQLWTNSNDECGIRCDEQMRFIKDFKGQAQILERGGFTRFTPHYITWYCPHAFILTEQCKSQCINRGRYCAPDPDQDFSQGYQGKDVVFENLRQLCVHRVTNHTRPWVWWDYVSDFHIRCSMKHKRYSKECADQVMKSLGLPIDEISKCIGDPEADAENQVLKTEQDLQVGHGSRGDVTILPTLVINDVQYRGKLEWRAVLKAVCAGFKETADPPVCLTGDLETNECLENNGGCWQDPESNMTACKDTYRGRVCECPTVSGIHYVGDGYTSCQAIGPGRCSVNNGGCWSDTRNEIRFSACLVGSILCPALLYACITTTTFVGQETEISGCVCPPGFRGDGHKCEDVDECKEGLACQCDGCRCSNTWGDFHCTCSNAGKLYIMAHDTCIERSGSKLGGILSLAVALLLALGTGIATYIFYKYRLRSYMDSEIMVIMSQYMPLDNHQNQALVHHETQPLTHTIERGPTDP